MIDFVILLNTFLFVFEDGSLHFFPLRLPLLSRLLESLFGVFVVVVIVVVVVVVIVVVVVVAAAGGCGCSIFYLIKFSKLISSKMILQLPS